MHVILESLFVGNIHEALDPPPLVTALLWAAGNQRITPPEKLAYACIPLTEYAEADPIDLEAGVDWLERHLPSHRILVCCRAGMSRSVSIVMAYLCCVRGMRYDKALQFMMAQRPGATPLPNLEHTIESVCRLRQEKGVQS